MSFARPDAAATLPRGPHKLAREEVVASQRSRLMRALAEAMAERGYANTTVADVLRGARVSRETFYQQFESKQDCFIATYEAAAGLILATLEHVSSASGTPLARFERTIEVYLDALASEPAFARLFMVEVYSAGDEVLGRRAEIQRRFTELVIAGFEARDSKERFACEALVAAVITMVTVRLAEGRAAELPALAGPLTELVGAMLAMHRDGES
jgi:AcrR family transcriptional regulator